MLRIDFMICAGDAEQGKWMADILSGKGYQVQVFGDAPQAIECLLSQGCRVAVLDADREAGLSFTQTVSIIKKFDPAIPIIAFSDDDSLEREREARSLEVFYYLVKITEEDELVRVAHDALKKSKARAV